MSIPLEDLFNDVIGKSQRGLKLSDEALAEQAAISLEALRAVKGGTADASTLAAIAPHLGLHGPSLIAMAENAWFPSPASVPCIAQFNTTWQDMTVNSYLVWDDRTKITAAFDTGAKATPMTDFIKANGLKLTKVFLTHTHPDHIADIAGLVATGNPEVLANEREPHDDASLFAVGSDSTWQLGSLRIEARNTYGHSKGGTTYVITGLAQPVAVVGDSLFASSMGGGMVSFADALETNRRELFTLPDNTVVCPGHGPLTTIGEEKQHNPFFPEFKA